MIKNVLQNLGMTPKEIEVYLVALELGTQPASVLARKVKIQRNTTRFILDKLVDKGWVHKATKANTQLYSPESPKQLINMLGRQKAEVDESYDRKIVLVQKVMEELQARYHPQSTKPKVSYYEGKEGIISMYEGTLKSSEPIRSLGCYDVMRSIFSDYFKSHHARRLKEKILVRRIHPDTPQGIVKAELDKKELRESRLIPHKSYYFTPEILGYDNNLLMVSWKELLGIHIESREVAEAYKVIFELAWQEAGRLDARLNK
jgi:sugar-specific transcriptional regulator TrmB